MNPDKQLVIDAVRALREALYVLEHSEMLYASNIESAKNSTGYAYAKLTKSEQQLRNQPEPKVGA